MLEIRLAANHSAKQEYDRIYSDEGICHLDSFYKWLLKQLSPQPGKLILDVACGDRLLADWAKRIGLKSHGVDFSRRSRPHIAVEEEFLPWETARPFLISPKLLIILLVSVAWSIMKIPPKVHRK